MLNHSEPTGLRYQHPRDLGCPGPCAEARVKVSCRHLMNTDTPARVSGPRCKLSAPQKHALTGFANSRDCGGQGLLLSRENQTWLLLRRG